MPGIIERYHSFLPVESRFIVTLEEGSTPLLPARRLAETVFQGILDPVPKLFLKLEGLNPTGSFKDRGMTYAVSKALEGKSRAVICASTGNTSASAAAYAARAGLPAYVVIPHGKIARGKLSQAVVHGAHVVAVRGNFDEALRLVKKIAEQEGIVLVNSTNPHRLEGQKTAAFEVCESLSRVPTHHLLPVGNAGNITAYWKGYKEWRPSPPAPLPYTGEGGRRPGEGSRERSLPKMMGFQAAGAAPIVIGRPVKNPETIASAIRIGNPASWQGALKARDESKGVIDKVTDREIIRAYRMIAEQEGYFCEPASAAAVAGLYRYAKKRWFRSDDLIVCTLTGHGLKDPETALQVSFKPMVVPATLEKVVRALQL